MNNFTLHTSVCLSNSLVFGFLFHGLSIACDTRGIHMCAFVFNLIIAYVFFRMNCIFLGYGVKVPTVNRAFGLECTMDIISRRVQIRHVFYTFGWKVPPQGHWKTLVMLILWIDRLGYCSKRCWSKNHIKSRTRNRAAVWKIWSLCVRAPYCLSVFHHRLLRSQHEIIVRSETRCVVVIYVMIIKLPEVLIRQKSFRWSEHISCVPLCIA